MEMIKDICKPCSMKRHANLSVAFRLDSVRQPVHTVATV